MDRRRFIKMLGGSLAACGGLSDVCSAASMRGRRPNVLFVAVDDLNDWIEPLGGHPQARTPNFNRLAEKGVVFTSAYCAAPACLPSRSALMSGKAPYESGIYENGQVFRDVLPDAVTIPQYFMEHGYFCAGAGKIYHNDQPDPQSWEDYYPSRTRHFPKYIYPDQRPANMPHYKDMYVEFDWWAHDNPDDQTGDYKSVEWVSEQMHTERDRPFFLACGLYRPHLPWFVPKKYFDMFDLDEVRLPKVLENDWDDLPERARRLANSQKTRYHDRVVEHGKWKQAVRAYLASIAYADAMVGTLLDAYESSPQADNTILVLWSDHGWQLGEKFHWRKFALWENVAKCNLMFVVPEGIRGLPGGAAKGSKCPRPVSLQHIYPTLIELCGLPEKQGVSGNSLVPLLKYPKARWDNHAITCLHVPGEMAISTQRYRYIRYNDGGEELYDLAVDKEEWHNLADDSKYAAIKKELADKLPKNPAPYVKTEKSPGYRRKKR
ncbi:MAG: sulfatase [Planctomycetota bacterium]|jgi:arylsulfatase A-like enzyme